MKNKPKLTISNRAKKLVLLIGAFSLLIIGVGVGFISNNEGKIKETVDPENIVQQSVTVYEPVLPDQNIQLPKDYSFHPGYEHEWWHYVVNLKDEVGKNYAVQWSVFRNARDESQSQGWQSPQIYMAHVVITTEEEKFYAERITRGGIGLVGHRAKPFTIWVENWKWQSLGRTPFPGKLSIETDDFAISLNSMSNGQVVLAGENGYRPKHDLLPVAAFQFDSPFIDVAGVLNINGKDIEVSGNGWLSKEWGSNLLATKQEGRDWFAVHLEDGRRLSVTQSRLNKQLPYSYGSLTLPSGKVYQLDDRDIEVHPIKYSLLKNGKRIPVQWIVNIPQFDLYLTTQVLRSEQWIAVAMPYWEGPIRIDGSVKGEGFMQLTGY